MFYTSVQNSFWKKKRIGRAEFEALFGGDPIPQPEEEGVVVEGI